MELEMPPFMMHEAEDKASEIRTRAQEEFRIHKANMVVVGKQKIIKEFEHKEKQIGVKMNIEASQELYQYLLKVLKARDDVLQKVFLETQQQLAKIGRSPQYLTILERLILQALLRINEPNVTVIGRKEDCTIIESVLNNVKLEYKEMTGAEA